MPLYSPKENISIAKYEDQFIIRRGVWNHLEIVFSRQEFVDNHADYDTFIDLLEKSFSPEGVSQELFSQDPYYTFILDQLIQFNLLVEADAQDPSQKADADHFAVIVEKKFLEDARFIFPDNDLLTIEELDALLSDQLLTKLDYLAYEKNVSDLKERLPYDRLVVLVTTPRILFLNKLNRLTYELSLPWSLGLVDGSFLTMTAFNRQTTGCFECLRQSNEVRMQGYLNYIEYVKHEKDYQHRAGNREDFLLMASFIHKLDTENRYYLGTVLEGMVLSIYTPTFEMNVERLLRTPMCTTCGHVSIEKAQDYNVATRNALQEVLHHADA